MTSLDHGSGSPSGMPRPSPARSRLPQLLRAADNYGTVLGLLVLVYLVGSAFSGAQWERFLILALLGLTLLLTLHVSRSSRVLVVLAVAFLIVSMLSELAAWVWHAPASLLRGATFAIGFVLLITAPLAILRHIAGLRAVTAEAIIGAICIYVAFGICFGFLYAALGNLAPPFFVGQPHATANDYLFFSFTTLTTLGYGNLVPVGNLGRSLAVLEAIFGQIYLVVIVARLVSLWGQERREVGHPAPPAAPPP